MKEWPVVTKGERDFHGKIIIEDDSRRATIRWSERAVPFGYGRLEESDSKCDSCTTLMHLKNK